MTLALDSGRLALGRFNAHSTRAPSGFPRSPRLSAPSFAVYSNSWGARKDLNLGPTDITGFSWGLWNSLSTLNSLNAPSLSDRDHVHEVANEASA